MLYQKNLSLKKKIKVLTFLCLVMFILLSLVSFSLYQSKKSEKKIAEKYYECVAKSLIDKIDNLKNVYEK